MKIGIQTCGSRGDIQPLLGLAKALQASGHQVTLFYTSFFGQDFVRLNEANLICLPTSIFDETCNYRVPSKEIFAMPMEAQMDYIMGDIIQPFHLQMSLAAQKLSQENELVIGVTMAYQLICWAEKCNTAYISYQVDNVYLPTPDNSECWLDEWIDINWASIINDYRNTLALKPVAQLRRHFFPSKLLNLLAFSPLLEPTREHWGDKFKVCGYLDNDASETIQDDALNNFLHNGTAPVFISMGSMLFYEQEPDAFLQKIIRALELADCRAVIQWNRPAALLNNNIYLVDYVPHKALLPHCAGMVHHGGSGTVHTLLKMGCPSIVIAYAFDQFFWGQKLVENGSATFLMARKNFDEIILAGELRKLVHHKKYRDTANYIRSKMKRERGIPTATKAIIEVIHDPNEQAVGV